MKLTKSLLSIISIAIIYSSFSCTSKPSLTKEEIAKLYEANLLFKKAEKEYNNATDYIKKQKALLEIEKAANMGDVEAMYLYGWHFVFMMQQPNTDEKETGAKWVIKSAESGYIPATGLAGVLYLRGFGVSKSHKKAFKTFLSGSKKGDLKSIYNLAMMYWRGTGIEKDYSKSAKWFKVAVKEHDDTKSATYLALHYLYGKGVFKNYNTAEKLLNHAAEKGDPEAMTLIGTMWKTGVNHDANVDEARKWYKNAVEKGYAPAKLRLEKLNTEFPPSVVPTQIKSPPTKPEQLSPLPPTTSQKTTPTPHKKAVTKPKTPPKPTTEIQKPLLKATIKPKEIASPKVTTPTHEKEALKENTPKKTK